MNPLWLLASVGWFWLATSPSPANCPQCVRQTVSVGPYNSEFGCKDWLGSALYDHTPQCRQQKPGCEIIGNGFVYPSDTPFPPPQQIPSGTCYKLNVQGEAQGWYFMEYDGDGHLALMKGKGKKLRKANKAGKVTGSRSFFVGDTHE